MEDSRDRARLTAASAPLVLAGVEYRMSPLSDRDIAELDEWVQIRYVNLVLASLPAEAEQEERDALRVRAAREALGMTWMSGEGARLMATVDGVTRLLWQSLRREHPDIKEEDLRRLLYSPENIAATRHTFTRLNAAPRGAEKKGKHRGRRRRERYQDRRYGGNSR